MQSFPHWEDELNEPLDRRSLPLTEDYTGERARIYGTERAILVGIEPSTDGVEDGFAELEALASTAGIPTLAVVTQKRQRPDPSSFIGKGKVAEVKAAAEELDADVILFNDELSPAQGRNLEEALGRKVIDRTQLILDIFAQRAATKEARLQVELAQLRYLLPRLRGWGEALSRLGAGIGTRGPGETKLEIDRKKLTRRMHTIERRLKKAKEERTLKRKQRTAGPLAQIVLAGYTNSGKSTLLNQLCDANALVEDQLFATLATTVRRGELTDGRPALFTDTVGFIRDLPHHLIPAFAATLEAIREADLVLHIVDASRPDCEDDHRAVLATLDGEVFAMDDPRPPFLDVLNKIDLPVTEHALCGRLSEGIRISAKTGAGIDRLLGQMVEILDREKVSASLLLPYAKEGLLHRLFEIGGVTVRGYAAAGIEIDVCLLPAEIARLKRAGARPTDASSQTRPELP